MDHFDDTAPLHLETLALREGQLRTDEGAHGEPIFTTSSYVFDSAAQAAARFSGDEPGNIYSRFTNPTVRSFEQRLAAMEGAERCVATASGMAAILSTVMALLEAGDEIISSRSVFGTTNVLFEKYLQKFGIKTTFVSLTDMGQWEAAITSKTKLLFLETPSNPLCEVANVVHLAELAHNHGALLVVDNCFCTPALQRPLEFGADIALHSATKFLDGQGRCIGGAVCGRNELMEEVFGFLRSAGPTMSPFNAWVFLKGLETLSLRMQAHSANALRLADWLEQHVAVEKVFYAGLPSHPQHLLAREQQSAFGGVLSFRVKGGREQAWGVIDDTRFLSITGNLGDAKTTITHPATTTHGRLSDEAKAEAGISENLIRVAVGLEHIDDIKADLARGLNKLI
ncbi:MAG: O-succinylhomoserine sulfhydrylase [Pseudomonadales bacterium]|uniref:O-succinylhomoserine sulfhydrylase n=1 Tax=unclassified Ketobacter TaxID=2639109 RepID=UPI000C4C0AF0|nr:MULTISPECIES: O-succinylhomoserine sulfhydrylase [unclassified Ketobacter]MAA59627.1 O-succinylhomoserine sulfhydrylase [Pseudomonadales bacterium]MEC8811027.1 O-succinylhomoserine sulfhydrylase [Pseudomonadota bacterium]TNC88711.1 MAG: O-succinylhomoserine sulfhydrylase [Alcanivorax sp.]HBO94431.1 O-succinylhomoserine sulfhydrylase [Gammaproteobacteria bacterium]MAQ25752.1 O-succinylhomoserine sulfhydrylase [Pseudomonadales bacterium]|tara:strand:- start:38404 stop:39597 length:1194 start_codon:yes stop_codon:yes gene_type:complete